MKDVNSHGQNHSTWDLFSLCNLIIIIVIIIIIIVMMITKFPSVYQKIGSGFSVYCLFN